MSDNEPRDLDADELVDLTEDPDAREALVAAALERFFGEPPDEQERL